MDRAYPDRSHAEVAPVPDEGQSRDPCGPRGRRGRARGRDRALRRGVAGDEVPDRTRRALQLRGRDAGHPEFDPVPPDELHRHPLRPAGTLPCVARPVACRVPPVRDEPRVAPPLSAGPVVDLRAGRHARRQRGVRVGCSRGRKPRCQRQSRLRDPSLPASARSTCRSPSSSPCRSTAAPSASISPPTPRATPPSSRHATRAASSGTQRVMLESDPGRGIGAVAAPRRLPSGHAPGHDQGAPPRLRRIDRHHDSHPGCRRGHPCQHAVGRDRAADHRFLRAGAARRRRGRAALRRRVAGREGRRFREVCLARLRRQAVGIALHGAAGAFRARPIRTCRRSPWGWGSSSARSSRGSSIRCRPRAGAPSGSRSTSRRTCATARPASPKRNARPRR